MNPSEQDRAAQFQNTERDEATLGKSGQKYDTQPGLADEDQPQWRPPESDPEPRPPEPTLDRELASSQLHQ